MKWIANRIMTRRAERLYDRLREHLPFEGTIADIGSGTGHNAESIRRHTNRTVVEFDVANLRWAGPVAQRILQPDGRIPAEDAAFRSALVLFVLHYPCDPLAVLHEIRRITTDSVLVIQSTYNGALSQLALKFREFFLGRFGFYLARSAGLVSSGECPLVPHHYFTIEELLTLFASAGFHVCRMQSEESPIFAVSRTLFILKHNDLKE
jgi:ubiquinone/menaquinone biosynthesis C-methylase UbiE